MSFENFIFGFSSAVLVFLIFLGFAGILNLIYDYYEKEIDLDAEIKKEDKWKLAVWIKRL